jgi:hypothetical protein
VVGWILLIITAVLMLYVADTIVYIITWLTATLSTALAAVGVHIDVFSYLDIMYPYMRTLVQVLSIGILAVAILHITLSIRESR